MNNRIYNRYTDQLFSCGPYNNADQQIKAADHQEAGPCLADP